jgi:sugar lactone lactonase YvrE
MPLLAVALILVPGVAGRAQSAYVPPVVVTSVGAVPVPVLTKAELTGSLTNLVQPSEVMLDACGNIYTLDFGTNGSTGTTVTELPANGGPATVVSNVGEYYPTHIGQDPTRTNLIVGQAYGTGGNLIPLVNCVPQPSNAHHVGGGSGALFYYYNPGYFAGDFSGNTYISTNGACCVTGNYYLVQEVNSNGNILLTNQAVEVQSLAVDKNQNIYYISAGALFELPFSGGTNGTYATAGVPYGTGYSAPVGLSVDTAGNLYIADEGAAAIYEIPYETAAAGTGALNLADQFTVATGVSINSAVAVSARGDLYYTPQNATAVERISLGNADFGLVPVGQTATRTLNFQFNAAVTPASVQLPTGVFGTAPGSHGSVTCTAGVGYVPVVPNPNPQKVSNFCTINVTFTPTAVGKQSSAVILADAKGNSLATAYIEGVGQGPVVTLDPGTPAATGSGLKSPRQITLDGQGNTFIADSSANAIVEFPAGGGSPVTLTATVTKPGVDSTGKPLYSPLTVAAPTGVAVDGAGDVFVADTGNNRVIEIPVIAGALSTASAKFIADGFNAPASIYLTTNGDLYVTDTGNNQVLFYPHSATGYGAPTALATGLNAPLATTVDASGNVFIANSGEGTILELPLGGGLETVDAGLLNPSGLATDSSGALFVADQGNFRILRIPSVAGVLNTNSAVDAALGVANPYGVTVDAASNLYVTDNMNAAAYIVNRSQVSLSFGDLAVAATSDPLPLTVESAGNLPVIFNAPYFTGTGNVGDFAMTSPTGACADGITLASGSTCDLSTTFMPTATGTRSETIAFSNNAVVPTQAMLSGSGITLATTTTKLGFTYAAGPNAPFYGEPLVFAATVTGTTPSGSVSFIVDGVQVALLPLVSGVATLPLNSGLTGGTHSVYAVYKGDTANDGSSSAPLSISIAKAPTTSVLTVNKVAFTNPYSLRHSNGGSCSILNPYSTTETAFPKVVSDGVGFIGTVTSPGVGIPSGTLTFYVDGVLLNSNSTATPKPPSAVSVAPTSSGFAGSITSDADTLGDGTILGENNVLIAPHQITVVYSGDQNYLPSTSAGVLVDVVDVSPTTPVLLPQQPLGKAPYCTSDSPIATSQPSDPATYQVQASAATLTATSTVPGSVQLTFTSLGNYFGFISISCPDLPKYASCTSNPGQPLITPSTQGAPTIPTVITLTITTNIPPNVPTANQSRFIWLPALLLGIATLSSRRRFKRIGATLTVFGLALLLIGGLAGLSGCGSGSSASSSAVTPAGSYPIHVVMTGAQEVTGTYNGQESQNGFTFQPDLPYSIPLNLVVK